MRSVCPSAPLLLLLLLLVLQPPSRRAFASPRLALPRWSGRLSLGDGGQAMRHAMPGQARPGQAMLSAVLLRASWSSSSSRAAAAARDNACLHPRSNVLSTYLSMYSRSVIWRMQSAAAAAAAAAHGAAQPSLAAAAFARVAPASLGQGGLRGHIGCPSPSPSIPTLTTR